MDPEQRARMLKSMQDLEIIVLTMREMRNDPQFNRDEVKAKLEMLLREIVSTSDVLNVKYTSLQEKVVQLEETSNIIIQLAASTEEKSAALLSKLELISA